MMKKVALTTLAVMAVLHPSLVHADADLNETNDQLNDTAFSENGGGLLQSHHDPHFCSVIRDTWWDKRANYKKQWPYTDSGARKFCSQFDGQPEKCYHSGQDYDHAMVMCEIEGHGHNSKCVPINCAHLNAGQCNYEATGGMCQWFHKSPYGRGCMKNPCNLAGRPDNSKHYCENDPEFLKFIGKYEPKVKCSWCSNKQGCSNVDPSPKGGCARIGAAYVNRVAKQAAKDGLPVGQILQMHKGDPGYAATGCGDSSKVLHANVSPIECIEGQVGCSRKLGFKPKYKEGKKKLSAVNLENPEETETLELYFNNISATGSLRV